MARYTLKEWNGNIVDNLTGDWLGLDDTVERLNVQNATIEYLRGIIKEHFPEELKDDIL